MNEGDLDKVLERLKESRMPEAPGDLRARVWRAIREAASKAESRGWAPSFWPEWMLRPAFGIAFVTITFCVGVLLGSARAKEQVAVEAAAGHRAFLDVFHERGPGSPYDRLFYRNEG